MLRAWALALLFLAPTAGAFATTEADLSIVYAASGTPTIVSAGALFLDGSVSLGLVLAGSSGTLMERIPELVVVDRSLRPPVETVHRGASLEIVAGSLAWIFPEGASATLATSERYAIGIALPQAPVPSSSGVSPAGFLLASEAVTGTIGWTAGDAALAPLDAIVTIRDARGQPIPDWDARRVNAGATAGQDLETLQHAFVARGAFTTRVSAQVLGGATGGEGQLQLVVGPAEEDRYAQTAEAFRLSTSSLFGPTSPISGDQDPLALFEPVSGLLNGALLIVPGVAGGEGPAPVLVSSSYAGEEFPMGAFNLVRGEDLALGWTSSQMRLEGRPTVALGRDGFGVEEPARIGVFPLVSLLLWVIAIGAVVLYFVRRPPEAQSVLTLRLASLGVHLVLLVLALYLWDRSFEQTFGTGVVSSVRADGFSTDALPRLGMLAAIELIPWSIAALFFALPVRIAAGVGLRYLGRGKSYKGVASGAALMSLALLGPLYALWCFNLVWAHVAARMPAAGA